MIKEYKDKWLKALRSGKYNQARNRLKCKTGVYEGFCCLGVLMNIYDSNGWEQDVAEVNDGNMYHKSNKFGDNDGYVEGELLYGEASQDSELTNDTLSNFGISTDEQCHLIKMNDHRLSNFNEIADWIEEKL